MMRSDVVGDSRFKIHPGASMVPAKLRVAVVMLAVVTVAFVVLGIFFRAYALDRKVYGFDETATLLRVAGTTLPQFVRSVDDGSVHSTADVRNQYQRLQPGANAGATIHSLAVDDPQHPPLYYVLERWWQTFGDSIAFDRTLAVIFGIALLRPHGGSRENSSTM